VCGRGVGNNSIQCTSFQKWVHRNVVDKGKHVQSGGCMNPVTGTG